MILEIVSFKLLKPLLFLWKTSLRQDWNIRRNPKRCNYRGLFLLNDHLFLTPSSSHKRYKLSSLRSSHSCTDLGKVAFSSTRCCPNFKMESRVQDFDDNLLFCWQRHVEGWWEEHKTWWEMKLSRSCAQCSRCSPHHRSLWGCDEVWESEVFLSLWLVS